MQQADSLPPNLSTGNGSNSPAPSRPGSRLATVEPAVAVAATRRSGALHGDLAGRLLVANARQWRATRVTADEALMAYGRVGHVVVLSAG